MPTTFADWLMMAAAIGATGLALALAFHALRAFRVFIAAQQRLVTVLDAMRAEVQGVRADVAMLEERLDAAERFVTRGDDAVSSWGRLAGSATG